MGTFLIVLGLLVLAAAAANWWWKQQPDTDKLELWLVLPGWLKNLVPQPRLPEETVVREEPGGVRAQVPLEYVPLPQRVALTLQTVPIDSIVEFDQRGRHFKTSNRLTGRLTLKPKDHIGGGRFRDRQEPDWPAYLFDGDKLMLIHRPDGWYAFNRYLTLTQDETKVLYPYGEQFAQRGQVSGSVVFDWVNSRLGINWQLSITDVGYLEVARNSGDGQSHLPNLEMVKFMLAAHGGETVYVEDSKSGDNCVWVGVGLGDDLTMFLGDIFPPM